MRFGTVRHDPAQRRCQRVGEVLACILRAQVAHVEVQRLLNELAAAFAVSLLQPAVHAADRRGSEPSGNPRLVFMFHFVFSFVLIVVVDAKFVRIDLNADEDE